MNRFHITIVGAAACLVGISSIAAAPGVGEPYRRQTQASPHTRLTPSGVDLDDLLRSRLRAMGPVTILPSLPAQADAGLAPLFPGAELDLRTGRIRLPEFGVCILPTYPAQLAPRQDAALAPRLRTFRLHDDGPLFVEPEDETFFAPAESTAPAPE